ncbi:MAG: hypothetical protein AB8B54_13105 [Sphingorhabdus sp.]
MKSNPLRLIALALGFSLVASCSESNDLPVFADTYAEQSCDCLLQDNCPIPEMAEGRGKQRGFQCQWTGEKNDRAVCSYETKFDYDDPNIADRNWSAVSVDFTKMQSGQWCWRDQP